jgi:hypothetical protein
MADKPAMIALNDALPKECYQKLQNFITAFARNRLVLEPGKSIRQLLKERVLEPYQAELEGKWDLDYLSWAVCYTVYRRTGLDLCELEGKYSP